MKKMTEIKMVKQSFGRMVHFHVTNIYVTDNGVTNKIRFNLLVLITGLVTGITIREVKLVRHKSRQNGSFLCDN